MVIQALKWIGNIVAAAVAGAIVHVICTYLGLSLYLVGMGVGFAIAGSLQVPKPSPYSDDDYETDDE